MKTDRLNDLRKGRELNRRGQISLVLMLSFPAIMSMISTIIMDRFDLLDAEEIVTL